MAVNPILERVRQAFEESGTTQTALEKAKVASQSAISAWFTRDDIEPSASALARFAMHLNYNGHWLLTGQGEKRAFYTTGSKYRLLRENDPTPENPLVAFEAGVQYAYRQIEVQLKKLATSPALGGGESGGDVFEQARKGLQEVQAQRPSPSKPRRKRSG